MGFFTAMFDELGVRRRRLRELMGDRGQSLFEFALLSAFVLGSAGLFVRAWGPGLTPWGFALPFVFLLGYAGLDWRRQGDLARGADEEATRKRYNLAALALALITAGLAVFAFVLVLSHTPPPPPVSEEEVWEPPSDTVNFDLQP
jgi:hypothetical protein